MVRRLIASIAASLLVILVFSAALMLAACSGASSNDNANNVMNVDENLTTTDANAVETNAVDMNAVDMNTTDMNAMDMNATADANATDRYFRFDTNAVNSNAIRPAFPKRCPDGSTVAQNQQCPGEPANNSEVQPGQGSFTEPPPMEIGGWYTVEFHTGPNEQALSEQAQGADTTAPQPIHISRRMKVTLQPDPNFEIKAKSEVDQDTGADWAATWDWDVKPVSAGTHRLIAHVEVLMHDNKGKLVHYDQYDSRVGVKVKVGSWQGLLIGLDHAKTLSDKLTLLFQSWRGMLLALAALILAGFGVRSAVRRGRKRPPSGR